MGHVYDLSYEKKKFQEGRFVSGLLVDISCWKTSNLRNMLLCSQSFHLITTRPRRQQQKLLHETKAQAWDVSLLLCCQDESLFWMLILPEMSINMDITA